MLEWVTRRVLSSRATARLLKARALQPFWEQAHKLALYGMNYGGGYDLMDSGELWVLRRLRHRADAEPDRRLVVIDAGANQGHYARSISDLLGPRAQIHCFEPSPSAFQVLRENLEDLDNARLVNVGLNDQDGTFTLYSNDPGSVVSSLYLCRTTGGATVRATEECRLTTLDEYCREQDIGRIDHLKLDVEGNEYKVLRGAARLLEAGAIEQVQFEFGEAQIDSRTFFRDLFELLAPSYDLYRVLWSGLRPIPRYNPILEVFRTTNYLAIRRQHPGPAEPRADAESSAPRAIASPPGNRRS